jgi:hypothetical protein
MIKSKFNIGGDKKIEIWSIKFIFLFVLIIYTGNTSVFTNSLNSLDNVIGFSLPLLLGFILAINSKVKITKQYFKVIGIFVIYFVATSLYFRELHFKFFLIWINSLTLSYIIVNSYKSNFFRYYEAVIVKLSIISIIGWFFLLTAQSSFVNIIDAFAFSEPSWGNTRSNIIIYAVQIQTEIDKFAIVRNSGFAWEPGVFSVLVVLGIYCNLILNRFKINNRNFWILLIALLTTQSSTGYGLFLVIVIYYAININSKYKSFMPILFIPFIIYVFSLDFMGDKILELMNFDIEERVEISGKYDIKVAPQRFESFIIDWRDFMNYPILGYGGHTEGKWTEKIGVEIYSISGIGKVFGRYGLFGVVLFFTFLYKSSLLYKRMFQYEGKYLFALIIMIISISYSIIETPLILTFLMFAILLNSKKPLK